MKTFGLFHEATSEADCFNNCLYVDARYADLKTRGEHVTMGITKFRMELCAADLHGFNFLCSRTFFHDTFSKFTHDPSKAKKFPCPKITKN